MVDFDKLTFEGDKVVEAYRNKGLDHRIACKLASGLWGLYDENVQDFTPHQKVDWAELKANRWDQITTPLHCLWVSPKTQAVQKTTNGKTKEAPCVCSSMDIFNYGCPAARGLKCRSMK